MLGVGEDRGCISLFNRLPVFYHHQLVTQRLDHRQVVADEQVGQVVLGLQVAQQFHHLALHGTVEGRGRLVQQNQPGLEHQGAGNSDALALAAGKFVGVAIAGFRVQAHFLQRGDNRRFLLGGSAHLVDTQAFADDLAHAHARAQAAERVLEHHLHFPAQRAHLLLAELVHLMAFEANATLARNQPQNCQAQGGFARAAFTDDAQRLALGQAEVDAIHRLDVIDGIAQEAFLDREPDLQVIDFQQRWADFIGGGAAAGFRCQQLLGVRVLRRLEQAFAFGLLDDAAFLHHAYPVGNAPYQVQVVADQQQRHAQARLQFLEQLQDLQLHGDVECRGRFVGDQQFRLIGQGHGDHHPLALAAGQLVGQRLEAFVGLGDAHQFQQLQGAFGGHLAGKPLVQAEHFVDLLLDGVQRVQRGHRLLENHRNPVAADMPDGLFLQGQQIVVGVLDRARRVTCQRVGQQAQYRVRRDRLARAAFAHQCQGFAALDIEADVVHHPLVAVAYDELDGEVADFDQIVLIHLISSGRMHRERTRR